MGKKVKVVLGDETGIVNCVLPNIKIIKVGSTILLFNTEAAVVKEHIELQLKDGKINKAKLEIKEVLEGFNISVKEWVAVEQS